MHSEARLCEGIPEKPFPIDGPGGVVKPMEPGLRWIFAIKGQLSCNDPCWLGVEGGCMPGVPGPEHSGSVVTSVVEAMVEKCEPG